VTAQKIQPLEWDNTRNSEQNAAQGNTGATTAACEPPVDDDIPF
jgi:hypothetical protein